MAKRRRRAREPEPSEEPEQPEPPEQHEPMSEQTPQPNPQDVSQMLGEAEEMLRQRAILSEYLAALVNNFDPHTDKDPWAVLTQDLFSTNGKPTRTETIEMNDLYGQILPPEYDAVATVVFIPKRFLNSDKVAAGWHGQAVSRSGELVSTQPETGKAKVSLEDKSVTGSEDIMLRAFQLPTKPPFISLSVWLTKLWVFIIAHEMQESGGPLSWGEAARLHGLVGMWEYLTAGELADELRDGGLGDGGLRGGSSLSGSSLSGGSSVPQLDTSNLQPRDLHALCAAFEKLDGWEIWQQSRVFMLERGIEDRVGDLLGLRPQLYGWYDTGSLSRYFNQMLDFADGGLSSWMSTIREHWDAAEIGRLLTTLELISSKLFGRLRGKRR